MPGDYSRKTFNPKKHYSGVVMQQGRVQLDADWNEQLSIQLHRTETETGDTIGLCGVPKTSDGFKIGKTASGRDLTISPGRIYVDGLLCELESQATYTSQPHFPDPDFAVPAITSPPGQLTQLSLSNGTYLVFIDVWRHEITSLDDPLIREVALGGPDTATRLQTVWQIKLLPVGLSSPPSSPPGQISCNSSFPGFDALTAKPTGLMNARTKPPENKKDPCLLPPSEGFSGLENQLYRIEVHTGGDRNTATFKWSRENASVETTIQKIEDDVITVSDIGKDEVLGFAAGQWVEIVDEESTLKFAPRTLVQINSVNEAAREITLKTSVAALAKLTRLKLRRWDQSAASANASGLKMSLANWVDVENSIQVQFSAGTYRAGDYWLIPARTALADAQQTATGEIEWPPFEVPNDNPVAQPPKGVNHHYCRLALIEVASGVVTNIEDCRNLFPPLTKLTHLYYVSGDGQETQPGQLLPQPIQVGVANGSFPVEGARVRFRIIRGSGVLRSGSNTSVDMVVKTGADGVAECTWQLDANTQSQRVEASLVSGATLPVRFNAGFTNEVERGIRIKGVRLPSGQELRNDTEVTVSELAGGIRIQCDSAVNPQTIVPPTCFVTLDMPFPFNHVDRELWQEPVIGFQPLTLAADVGAKDDISWRPFPDTQKWLIERLFQTLRELGRGDRLLVRLTLKGNFILAKDSKDTFLDGEVFGLVSSAGSNIDIRLPSGNDQRGGDFEMWFWLVPDAKPLLKVTSVRILSVPASNPATPNPNVRAIMNSPATPITIAISAGQPAPNVIEAQFNIPVDPATVNARTFIVSQGGTVLAGQPTFMAGNTIVRWVLPNTLLPGTSNVALRGSGSAPIASLQGSVLDGEPLGLPSGNNKEGGDLTFIVVLVVQPIP